MRTSSSIRTLRRVIAVTLTLLLLLLTFTTTSFAATGGDHGACGDGLWLKADWTGQGWDWEAGPGWDDDAPTAPALTVTSTDDGDPLTVDWTSDTHVLSTSVKASTEYAGSAGGYAGTVTGIDKTDDAGEGMYAISHIVFCYGPEPVLVSSIGLQKTSDLDTVTYDPDDGDDEVVTYTYLVTNTGETPLTDVTLVDDVLGTITLDVTDLAVGASTTGTATHVVTAQDAQAGEILNTAVATGTAPDQTTVDATDTATVLVEVVAPVVLLTPGISLQKTALVTPDDGRKVVTWDAASPTATTVTYEYVITNTGETLLTDVTLVDDVLGPITLDVTELDVGESTSATATHIVTEADADAGSVSNVAVANATARDGTEVSDTAEETVLVAEVQGVVIDEPEVEGVVIDEPDVEGVVIDEPDVEGVVIDEPEVQGVAIDKEEQLPVTGSATALLALVASLSLAAGAGLLRASPRKE